MATNYLQQGDVLTYHNDTDNTIASGQAVLVGKRLGVALTDIMLDTTGALRMVGVFQLPKAAVDIDVGTPLYWQVSEQKLTKTATDNTLASSTFASATAADATIVIKINA